MTDDELVRLREENARLRAALQALAARGIHADTTPTMSPGGWPTMKWYEYLIRADVTVRDIAQRALDNEGKR